MNKIFPRLFKSNVIIVLIPSVVFLSLYTTLKFFFITFSDKHELKISPVSNKIINTIRDYKSSNEKIKEDSTELNSKLWDSLK